MYVPGVEARNAEDGEGMSGNPESKKHLSTRSACLVAVAVAMFSGADTVFAADPRISFERPLDRAIVDEADLSFSLRLDDPDVDLDTLNVSFDGNPVGFEIDPEDPGPGRRVIGTAPTPGGQASMTPGPHEWAAEASYCPGTTTTATWIDKNRQTVPSLDPPENSGRTGLRCSAALKRADSRDLTCRFQRLARALTRGTSGDDSYCDQRIRRTFQRAQSRYHSCPAESVEARIAANRDRAAAELAELGLGSGSNRGKRCERAQVSSILRHRSCETAAQSRENRGRDASSYRARCDQRLQAAWDRIASRFHIQAVSSIEAAHFPLGDECDPTNSASCGLPFPSMAFLDEVGAQTATGYRMSIPQEALPGVNGDPIRADHWDHFDGFSPTVPILMNFPNSQVDLEASGAPINLEARCCGQSQSTPYEGIRVRGPMNPNGPTVLLDLDTGETVPHFVELDSRTSDPARRTLIMRPDASLKPGGYYAVAIRNLVDTEGNPVAPEPAFRALRDGNPTRVPSIEARRPDMEDLFERLRGNGIPTDNLTLAFAFVVRSDEQLTQDMLWMRDDALRWIDENRFEPWLDLAFNIDPDNYDFDCAATGSPTAWRLRGTFPAPFYLQGDTPRANPQFYGNGQTLARDENGKPKRVGLFPLPFDIAIPCAVFTGEIEPTTLLVGHGLFGTGAGMVDAVSALGSAREEYGIDGLEFVTVGTDFRGLASPDLLWVGLNIIGTNESRLNNFPQFSARLQQSMIGQLVLSHVMKKNRFVHCKPADDPEPCPSYVFANYLAPAEKETFYYGNSLGGVMGIFHAALSDAITRYAVDVGASNFPMMLQRSTQFSAFEQLTEAIGLTDPMETVLGLNLLGELWISAEPAGYMRHVTGLVDPPLPGSHPKKMLMPVAYLDKQVSNEASIITARSLGIPNVEGSLLRNIPGMADAPSPQDSGFFVWDTGSFDIFDPAYDDVIPPLSNQIPSSACDPHVYRVPIHAALQQLATFAQPGGQVINPCEDGVCDASTDWERPDGTSEVCNPL
ncbi:MAG: hypothetical protein VX574_03040 [Myxococcota bacterium]|nr:hypothetical protein [Myxococcota bacterium]